MKRLLLLMLLSSSLLSTEDISINVLSSPEEPTQEEEADENPTSSMLCLTGALASLYTLVSCLHPLESSCCTALFWTGCTCVACTQSKFCNES